MQRRTFITWAALAIAALTPRKYVAWRLWMRVHPYP